jgi:hypothetical protein
MATSANAKVQYEAGQVLSAYAVMTDSGDHQIYTLSGKTVWSGKSGYTPSIRPNGMVSGINVLSASSSADTIDIAAFTAYSKGVLQSVSACTDGITRPGTAGFGQIYSITMASNGSIAVVEGKSVALAALVETRDATGGPPLIPVNSVEIGQVRVTASTAAVLASTEIFQVVGTHAERYDYPVWAENNIGDGNTADTSSQKNAYIKFAAENPLIHTGGVTKRTYAQIYTPQFSDLSRAYDFKPCENTHSVTSTQVYGGTVAASSKTLGQGGFSIKLADGITDGLVSEKDQILTIKFYQDENKTPYVLTQGAIGMARTYPAGDHVQADITISSEIASAEFTT